jgi:YgiT-type zinc finger domain-containing protein
MSSRITRCISCHSDKIKKRRGLFPVSVCGESVKVPGIEYHVCSQCGETFLDLDNETKIDLYLKQHRTRSVASGSS